MKAWQGSVAVSEYEGIVSPAYFVYKFTDEVFCKQYFHYLLRSCYKDEFMRLSGGIRVGQWDLPSSGLDNVPVLIPEMDEQRNIANFLDSKCTEIDVLAADIQSQIDTLEQYKRSVITEAVTKGLDPDAEMRDSGIQWIGKMPAHWGCIRGKYILKYLQKPVREDDGVITCFRDGEVTLRSNRREDGFTMADKEIGYQGVDVGDLVIHGMDGFAGAIGISDSRGKASPVLNVLATDQDKRYIMYFLRGMAYSDVFLALATGIRVRSCDLRWNKLSELFYPVPPLDEQQAIVDHIDGMIEKVNTIIADKKRQMEVLAEYKKSLIFEYVTGKKQVFDTAPTVTVTTMDPHIMLAGVALNGLGEKQLGKIQLEKVLYLFDYYLGLGLCTQYYRFPHGPYDLNLDSYLNVLQGKGWFRKLSRSPEIYAEGAKYSDFCKEAENYPALSREKGGIDKIISFVKSMSKTSQVERMATLFAAWNDFLIDGITPSDDQIIREIMDNWTENKAHSQYPTWKDSLNKLKGNGIIPKGIGLHTLPMAQRGGNHE